MLDLVPTDPMAKMALDLAKDAAFELFGADVTKREVETIADAIRAAVVADRRSEARAHDRTRIFRLRTDEWYWEPIDGPADFLLGCERLGGPVLGVAADRDLPPAWAPGRFFAYASGLNGLRRWTEIPPRLVVVDVDAGLASCPAVLRDGYRSMAAAR